MKKNIIIDVDMGSDDYSCVVVAIKSKKINIKGISLVHGNTIMKNVERNIFKTLDICGKLGKIKVYKGLSEPLKVYAENTDDNAHGQNGFSDVKYETIEGNIESINSVDWMIKEVNSNPKKITVVAVGPLTNIAAAIIKDKNFSKNVKQLVIMGGANNYGNITPYAEFNFYKDPYAAQVVLNSGIKNIVVIGFDITKNVCFDLKLENILKNSKNYEEKFFYDITRATAKLDREKGIEGATMSDPITICYLLNKNVIKLKKCNMEISLDKNERLGESIIDYKKKSNCKIAIDVNSKKCKRIIFNTMFPKIEDKLNRVIK